MPTFDGTKPVTTQTMTAGLQSIRDNFNSINSVTGKGEILAASAATTLAPLAAGTNGQILTADNTQPLGVRWGAGTPGSVVSDTIWDAKGDLAAGIGADAAQRVAVGTNGQVLTADDTQTAGVKWATVISADIGDIKMSAATTTPTKWLPCDAAPVSRSTYSLLFAAIGTTYGSGDGINTFNVPDLRARSPIGTNVSPIGAGETARSIRTIAGSGGVETHVLTTGELANHYHALSSNTSSGGGPQINIPMGSMPIAGVISAYDTEDQINPWSSRTGSNTPHITMHPFLTVSFYIYAGQ